MRSLRVLVVGGGAREHAIVWKLSQSPKIERVYAAPGNPGTAAIAQNLEISVADLDGLVEAAREEKIGLVVIGPEAPLAIGIVNQLGEAGIPAFGPTKDAALIESSKVFAKQLMHKYGIPCARDMVFTSFSEAREYVGRQPFPVVIKADGLAAGKGAIIAGTEQEALKALSDIMEARVFGDAGNQVLIEECLVGRETSLLAFTDGKTIIPIIPARDYKRALDDDSGPNTGGMGAYSPPRFFNPELAAELVRTVLEPTVKAMASEGRPYKGVLYAGLMLTAEGPKVLEYNARFGDPETQVQLPLLKGDLLDIMLLVVEGKLDQAVVEWKNEAAVGVVLASGGYPGKFQTGYPVSGLNTVGEGANVFHAGTKREDGVVKTAGGRVVTVVATGASVHEARQKAFENVARIHFEKCHYRTDIAAEEA